MYSIGSDGGSRGPPLAVPADPGRVRQRVESLERLERPRTHDSVVPTEQPAFDLERVRVGHDRFERGQVAVDVVEDAEHVLMMTPRQR
jgi:hypothetical protein